MLLGAIAAYQLLLTYNHLNDRYARKPAVLDGRPVIPGQPHPKRWACHLNIASDLRRHAKDDVELGRDFADAADLLLMAVKSIVTDSCS